MGGTTRHNKYRSSFSIFKIFKSKRGRKGDRYDDDGDDNSQDEVLSVKKAWPSDEDKRHNWVAVPGIDKKAEKYIKKIHQNRVLEAER